MFDGMSIKEFCMVIFFVIITMFAIYGIWEPLGHLIAYIGATLAAVMMLGWIIDVIEWAVKKK